MVDGGFGAGVAAGMGPHGPVCWAGSGGGRRRPPCWAAAGGSEAWKPLGPFQESLGLNSGGVGQCVPQPGTITSHLSPALEKASHVLPSELCPNLSLVSLPGHEHSVSPPALEAVPTPQLDPPHPEPHCQPSSPHVLGQGQVDSLISPRWAGAFGRVGFPRVLLILQAPARRCSQGLGDLQHRETPASHP